MTSQQPPAPMITIAAVDMHGTPSPLRSGRTPASGVQIVVEHMMRRAFRRRGPRGRLCRQLSSTETAFLAELCKIAVYGHGVEARPKPSREKGTTIVDMLRALKTRL